MFLSELYKIEISTSKLTDYLFNLSHPDGWSKAKYFHEHEIRSIDELQKLLLMVIRENKVSKAMETSFGLKFIVDGVVDKFDIRLRTVWIVLEEQNICKFVTAYPI